MFDLVPCKCKSETYIPSCIKLMPMLWHTQTGCTETLFFYIFLTHKNMKNSPLKVGYFRKIAEFSVLLKTTQYAQKQKATRFIWVFIGLVIYNNGTRLNFCWHQTSHMVEPGINFQCVLSTFWDILASSWALHHNFFTDLIWITRNFKRLHYGRCMLWDPSEKGHQVLHFYSRVNFITSWLSWLQMIWNDYKWLSVSKKITEVIWSHLRSFGII